MQFKFKSINSLAISMMLGFALLILFFSGFLDFPPAHSSIPSADNKSLFVPKSGSDSFKDLFGAYTKWDSHVGCANFRKKHQELMKNNGSVSSVKSLQDDKLKCSVLKMNHVGVLVKGWTWLPDNLDNLYSCRCGLSCLWTKSDVLVDKPDAVLFETTMPPLLCYCTVKAGVFTETKSLRSRVKRKSGDPLRVYMDLEAGRKRSGVEDIFISYHAKDDVQATYAGGLFHNNRNYQLSSSKNDDVLIYWSSSRCLPKRNQLAKSLLRLLPHHSFGKCLNNVGGRNMALSLYPECAKDPNEPPKWWDHLHCAMSHYKFVLSIENTETESYVTEKLFYALDSGAVPIYFGAPNVWDFVPPHSIIDGSKFGSMEDLASYVKALANDPVAYAEYHAWRRCGVLGNYQKTRAASLDTLPCRLCEAVSKKGGSNAKPF